MFSLSRRTFIHQECFLGTLSNTPWWTLSHTRLNSPCCHLSSAHRCSLTRAVEMLDSIPADRRQANAETIRRPTHTHTPFVRTLLTMRAHSTDGQTFGGNQRSWWEPKNGKNGHTHGNRTSCTVMVLSCTSVHQKAYLSVAPPPSPVPCLS